MIGFPARPVKDEEQDDDLRRRIEQLKKLEKDAFAFTFVAEGVGLILDLSAQYWRYFPAEVAAKVISDTFAETAAKLAFVDGEAWNKYLRHKCLQKISELCNSCQMCELWGNRLMDRGATFGEGPVDADVLVFAEGPGAFEQRTGIPFCDNVALRSSTCATHCHGFEKCFIDENNQFVRTAKEPCSYKPDVVDGKAQRLPNTIIAERIKKRNEIYTAGEHLTKGLLKAGLLRQSYVQLLRMAESAGTIKRGSTAELKPNVYCTNAIRCRHLTKDKETGQQRDTAPTVGQMDACRPWTELTLALVRPKTILALGNPGVVALKATLPANWKITETCSPDRRDAEVVQLPDNRTAFVALHPAYVMRKESPAEKDAYWAKLHSTIVAAAKQARHVTEEQLNLRKLQTEEGNNR